MFRFDGQSNGFKAPGDLSKKIEEYIDPQEIYVLLKQLNYDKETQFRYFIYLKRTYIALGIVAAFSLLGAVVSIPFIVTIFGALSFIFVLVLGGLIMLVIRNCSRGYLKNYIVQRKLAIDKVLEKENSERYKGMGLEWKCGEKGAWIQLTLFFHMNKRYFKPEKIKIEISENEILNGRNTEIAPEEIITMTKNQLP